jgi:hypothetical protein
MRTRFARLILGAKLTRARRCALVAVPALIVAMSASSTANATIYGTQDQRWPGGNVYFDFDPSLPQAYRDATWKAVTHYNAYSANTGVAISQGRNNERYVRILPTWSGPSRVSYTGYSGGVQYMYLNQNIVPIWQVVVHEFGHVIGLGHEHERCERDIWLNPGTLPARDCGLTAERYNPLSIMHYSDGELNGFGASLKPPHSAPAKSQHPGLQQSDLRSIATMYREDGTFSLVNVMHGKCLDAPGRANGTRVHMWTCMPGNANQRWNYSAVTGQLRIIDANKCLDAQTQRLLDYLVVSDCNSSAQQKWDIGNAGDLLLRMTKDTLGKPECAESVHWDRADGAELWLQYCHRGDAEQWRRSSDGMGGSTVGLVSDLTPPDITDPRQSLCADGGWDAPELYLWTCSGPTHPPQRFTRTAARELRLDGLSGKCVDAGPGQVGGGVLVRACNGTAGQKWELTSTGSLYGLNGLCIDVAGANNANGTRLLLATCIDSPRMRWSIRDPRGL